MTRRTVALVLSMFAALTWTARPALADTITITDSTLPSPRWAAAAAWDGSRIYIFGGESGGRLDEIVRFDPATGAVTVMGARLPTPRRHATAVWDGSHFYVFGGDDGSPLDQVVRYHPATGTVTVMGARLPTGRTATSAVWDGRYAYVFGGVGPSNLREIVRYDPAADAVAVMGATLPTGRQAHAAAWDGRHAYVFGGWDGSYLRQIVRYDPAADAVAVMGATLPTGRFFPAAAWDGRHAYVFGGQDPGGRLSQIVQFDPSGDSAAVMGATLPGGRVEAAAAWAGHAAYVLGGSSSAGATATVLRYDPPNQVPVAVIAPVPSAECVDGGATATLDGTGSFDSDGDPLTFAWSAPGVAFDDPASPTPSGRFPLGSTTVTLIVSDGRTSSTATALVRVLDTAPPATALTLSGEQGAEGWWVSDIVAALAASDACGPTGRTLFAVDGGEPREGTSFVVSGDGSHELRFHSVDAAGNAEAEQLTEVRIDTGAPTVALAEPAEGHAYVLGQAVPLEPALPRTLVVGDIVVRAEASDTTSGVDRVEFRVDGLLRFTDTEAPYEFAWDAGTEPLGDHVVEARAVDRAGRAAAHAVVVTTVPTTPDGIVASLP